MDGGLVLAMSQSGRSPDLLAAAQAAAAAGALVVALVNDGASPLAEAAEESSRCARAREQRRGDQDLHRLAQRHRPAGRALDRTMQPARGTQAACRAAGRPGSWTGSTPSCA